MTQEPKQKSFRKLVQMNFNFITWGVFLGGGFSSSEGKEVILVATIHLSPFTCNMLFPQVLKAFIHALLPQRERRIHRITLMFNVHYLNPTGRRLTNHSNLIHIFTPITRMVATKEVIAYSTCTQACKSAMRQPNACRTFLALGRRMLIRDCRWPHAHLPRWQLASQYPPGGFGTHQRTPALKTENFSNREESFHTYTHESLHSHEYIHSTHASSDY